MQMSQSRCPRGAILLRDGASGEVTVTTHSASGSAIGYLFQVRFGLLALLRSSRSSPDRALTLELLDDVAFDQGGTPDELLQVKHHENRQATLSDKSTDLWKTLKVWMDTPVALLDDGPQLSMVTTASSPAGSAAALLREQSRNERRALELLDAAAASSHNKTTKTARKEWLALPESARFAIVAKTVVYDEAAQIQDVDDLVRTELSLAAPRDHEELFLELVLEWWSRVSLDLLRGVRKSVSGIDVRVALSEIRDKFSADRLPTLVHLSDADESALATEYVDRVFVHQLRWVDVNTVNIRKAAVDYYRAVTQTTRWLDEVLIGASELEEFEDRLVDEWQRLHADMIQDLGDSATADDKTKAGRELFRAVSASTSVTVRTLYDDPFYARGKRHELADSGHLGWHPEFQDLLSRLLGVA